MRTLLPTAAAIAAITLAGVGTAVPAAAQPAEAERQAAGTSIGNAAPTCERLRGQTMQELTLRRKPKATSESLGTVPKGEKVCIPGERVTGTYYWACKWRDNKWREVQYRGVRGYVMNKCLIMPAAKSTGSGK